MCCQSACYCRLRKVDLVWSMIMPNCGSFRFSARISADLYLGILMCKPKLTQHK